MAVLCERCGRSYRTFRALAHHVRDSPHHNKCPECKFDAATWDELLDHCREKSCRAVCQECDDGNGMHYDPLSDEYWDHVEEFDVCTVCEKHSITPDHFLPHRHIRIPHRGRYDCYRCPRTFMTYSRMIKHIERGTCSQIDYTDLNKLAARCYTSHHFMSHWTRPELLENGKSRSRDRFLCNPCVVAMPKLSSLFQHIESEACAQKMGEEPGLRQLTRFLNSRLNRAYVIREYQREEDAWQRIHSMMYRQESEGTSE